ncbi:hypothetical protein Droror1_Dr00015414 [Drosera rotundifolia]
MSETRGRCRTGHRFYLAPPLRQEQEQRQKVKDEKEEVVMVKKREVKEKKQGRELREGEAKGCGSGEREEFKAIGEAEGGEWIVYGAGVPLLLKGSDSVVQYYVPYLSAIQLYIDPSKPSLNIRRPGEESDGDSYRDLTDATVQGIRELSVRSEPLNGSSSDEGEPRSSLDALVFQYLEYAPPYSRVPFSDKMSALASGFPDLKAYRSCDLSPASWVSVAWETRNGFDMPVKLSLPSFGLAFYKFKISIWDQSGVGSDKSLSSHDYNWRET